MESRLIQLQEENALLERTIQDLNTSKAVEVRMVGADEKGNGDGNDDADADERRSQVMELNTAEGAVIRRRVDMLQEQVKDWLALETSQRDREERSRQELNNFTRRTESITSEYRAKLEALARQVADLNVLLTRISKSSTPSMPPIDLRKLVHEMQQEIGKTYMDKEKALQLKLAHVESRHQDVKTKLDRFRKHQDALVDQVLRDAVTGMAPKDRQLLKDEIRRLREDLDAAAAQNPTGGGGAGGGADNFSEVIGHSLQQQQLESENQELKLKQAQLQDECADLKMDMEALVQKLQSAQLQQHSAAAAAAAPPPPIPAVNPVQSQQQQSQQPPPPPPPPQGNREAEAMLHNLRNLLLSRQQAWDEERAKLLVRCTIAEEQLAEFQRLHHIKTRRES